MQRLKKNFLTQNSKTQIKYREASIAVGKYHEVNTAQQISPKAKYHEVNITN